MQAAGLTLLACCLLWACQGQDLRLGDGAGLGAAGHAAVGGDAARAGSDSPPAAADGGEASTPPPSAAPPVPDFSPPRLIAELSSDSDEPDDDPSLTEDQLLLCFNSRRDGGVGREDVWCASRGSNAEPWGAPYAVTELNSDARETGIALSADGLTIFFSSDRGGDDASLDVYVARREQRAAAWSAPTRVDELSSDQDDLVSSLDASERQLFLARRGDDYDILVATRSDTNAAWQAPTTLDEVNGDDEESDAFLVGPGQSLLFTRDEDLMLAQRSRLDEPFGAAVPLEALNSDRDDRDAWSDAAFRHVVFSSNRDGAYRLYEAER